MKSLEDVFGPPMAAPETRFMRRLRFTFIALALVTATGIVGIGPLTDLLGRAGAGGVLLVFSVATALIGIVFFHRKIRRDERWLLDRSFDRDGGGR